MKDDLIAVVGSAPNALLDLYSLIESTGRFCDIMAIGLDAVRMITGAPRYVATNHIEDIPEISHILSGKQADTMIISYKQAPGVDIVEPYAPIIERSGSSSMTGTLAAIRLGYKKIVLCGIPLTGNAPEGNPYEAFRLGWEDKKDELTGKVKSLSGWTKELLGNPTWEWLNE
ncbi:MAG: hypothetical protein WCJ37_01130 [Syntrophus sp. (in: bacteria)]